MSWKIPATGDFQQPLLRGKSLKYDMVGSDTYLLGVVDKGTEMPQTFKGNYMAGSWELPLVTAVTLTVKGRQT